MRSWGSLELPGDVSLAGLATGCQDTMSTGEPALGSLLSPSDELATLADVGDSDQLGHVVLATAKDLSHCAQEPSLSANSCQQAGLAEQPPSSGICSSTLPDRSGKPGSTPGQNPNKRESQAAQAGSLQQPLSPV